MQKKTSQHLKQLTEELRKYELAIATEQRNIVKNDHKIMALLHDWDEQDSQVEKLTKELEKLELADKDLMEQIKKH